MLEACPRCLIYPLPTKANSSPIVHPCSPPPPPGDQLARFFNAPMPKKPLRSHCELLLTQLDAECGFLVMARMDMWLRSPFLTCPKESNVEGSHLGTFTKSGPKGKTKGYKVGFEKLSFWRQTRVQCCFCESIEDLEELCQAVETKSGWPAGKRPFEPF